MSSHIGAGYGSEFHLMRYLARYRNRLNRQIEEKTGDRVMEWLDFVPGRKEEYSTRVPCRSKLPDHELVGLKFLKGAPEYAELAKEWAQFWPPSGNEQNWDAVAKMDISGVEHWLLVEAKANTQEIKSNCTAESESSIKTIDDALREMCEALGMKPKGDLKQKYYQYANRLAALYFLRKHNIPARLLFIYFLGDKNPGKEKSCPKRAEGWEEALREQYKSIGLDPDRKKAIGVIDLFLDVAPSEV